MPRLNIIDPETDNGPGADLLNGPLKDRQINIFRSLATNPGVLMAYLSFSQRIRAGGLTDAEHATVSLVTSEHRHCEYCTAAHTQMARDAGINEDEALEIRRGRAGDPRRQALIDFTKAVLETDGFISDEQLEAFRAGGFGDAAVIEVLAQIAAMTFTNYFNAVNQTEVDFPVPAHA